MNPFLLFAAGIVIGMLLKSWMGSTKSFEAGRDFERVEQRHDEA